MKTSQICLLLFFVVFSFAQSLNSQLIEAVCARPENEQLCTDLVEAAVKEYQRKVDESSTSQSQELNQMEKRKPSFVRFGKRSDGEMEKRKPSFVRFGRK